MAKKQLDIPIKQTDAKIGLTMEEVKIRTENKLNNPIKQKGSRSILGIILTELLTYFNLIYFVITLALLILGQVTQLTFLVVILSNLLIGIVQKIKSKLTIDKLSLLMRNKVTVIREGKEAEIDAQDIVRDDILKLGLGEQIASDSVLLDGTLSVNESLLTGESLPVKKEIGDKVLAGTYVVSGSALVRVEKCGKDNYIQQLTAQAKKYRKPKSEILNSLNQVIKIIGIALIPLAFLLYIRLAGFSIEESAILSTSGAILGMIPSGMFLLTSTTLAVSVIRLSKHNILVQELYCIEMLARVNLVCMDKTGTITDGSMKVKEAITLKESSRNVNDIIGNMLSSVIEDNPTSKALKEYFTLNKQLEEVKYYPFSSETKFFAVDYGNSGVYFLGAPEFLSDNQEIMNKVDDEARLGYRVLLLTHAKDFNGKLNKDNMTPIGMVVLQDNVRPDAIETIKFFKENGVGLKVISGDNPLTVSEVAKRAGVDNADKYISLHEISDEELIKIANEYTVFGRVSPQQKEILVKAFKNAGNTVAMIGDGVNDILALRESDCAIGIGGGSEAARNVSHIILMDSKFSSMKNVVAEGRRTTNNLQNTSVMFLTKTVICITLCLFCIITGNAYPFDPNQLMILEFFAIGVPSFFFALQPNKDLIKGKFLESILSKSLCNGLAALILCLPLYLFKNILNIESIETMIILLTTYNSMFVMLRLALPFNKYRFIVFTSMFVSGTIAFLLLSDVIGTSLFKGTELFNFLNLAHLSTTTIFTTIGLILLLPLLQLLFKFISEKLLNLIKTKRKA